ncbi:MAG: hypothetical protein QNJ51_19550 [Calothrix sp. MO_167.B12]|nr:hypothetical protein [Calothrix sp. MO_167.B12]
MKISRRHLLQGSLVLLGSATAFSSYLVKRTPAQTSGTCPVVTWDLTAGQTILVGTISVTNDTTNIYVTYKLTQPCWEFGTLHLWIGNDIANVPANPQGTPVPGQFCQAEGSGGACYTPTSSGTTEHTFIIPLTDVSIADVSSACPLDLYVFTHAEVKGTCDPNTGQNETAWGGPEPGTGPRWYFYGIYPLCCDDGPPVIDTCETAFAKGGYVFTTTRRSNPENLPSLNLTRNRWGWAINLTSSGNYTYDIWAGAGLNKTANGTKVGTLTVNWDGTTATVTYTMNNGYTLQEVHLYAGDTPPTTIAPGQYGYLDAFSPNRSEPYTFTVSLTETDGDGVWLIAHAVVCGTF